MTFGIPDLHKQLTLLALAALLAPAALLTGCEAAQPHGPDRVNADPILSDPAMAARSWPRTAAVYPCFSTTTGPTDTLFVARPDLPPYERAFAESPIFLMDVLLLPVAMIEVCPFEQVEASSIYLPPTYTANPPLEPRDRTNYSGGTALGYTPASGRAAPFPN